MGKSRTSKVKLTDGAYTRLSDSAGSHRLYETVLPGFMRSADRIPSLHIVNDFCAIELAEQNTTFVMKPTAKNVNATIAYSLYRMKL